MTGRCRGSHPGAPSYSPKGSDGASKVRAAAARVLRLAPGADVVPAVRRAWLWERSGEVSPPKDLTLAQLAEHVAARRETVAELRRAAGD